MSEGRRQLLLDCPALHPGRVPLPLSIQPFLSSNYHMLGTALDTGDSCGLGRLDLRPLRPLPLTQPAALPSPGASALQTLITAVGQTAYTVASVLILFFVLMYIFAILGFCLFGAPDRGDVNNWGNLAMAFFTLFSLATVRCLGTVWGGGKGP